MRSIRLLWSVLVIMEVVLIVVILVLFLMIVFVGMGRFGGM